MKLLQARVRRNPEGVQLVVSEKAFRKLGGDMAVGKFAVDVIPHSVRKRGQTPAQRMARCREILKLKEQGLKKQEIADKLQVPYQLVLTTWRDYGSYGLNTIRTHLSRYACWRLEEIYGMENPELDQLKTAIEADPLWRMKVLPGHRGVFAVSEVEALCQQHGFRIEPAIYDNNCAGLRASSYEKIRGLIGGEPRATSIKKLMDSPTPGLQEAYGQDASFREELKLFYQYKDDNRWR